MQLVDNLHCYLWKGRGNNCHSYLFRDVLPGRRPHVLIDPGSIVNELGEDCMDRLAAAMIADGIEPDTVGLVINTHSHSDHCDANVLLTQSANHDDQALIALSKVEDEYRKSTLVELQQMMGRKVSEFEADFYLEEGALNLGQGERSLTLELIMTPGHSPGSISIYWPQQKVLMTGDVVFNGSVGRTDFPGGSGDQLKQSIQRLAELEVAYLLPGHDTECGNIIRGNPRVVQNFAFIRENYFPML